MKQSPSAVELIQKVFNLSDGERNFLLNCDKGQGLFFAGQNHVGIQVLSSVAEHEIITSDPRDLEKLKEREGITDTRTIEELAQIFDPPAVQQPMRDGNSSRESEIIMGAIETKEKQKKILQDERTRYQEELEKRLTEQEKIINPNKPESQETFLDQLNKRTLTGQVLSSRKSIQKDKEHLTPQGYVESYPEDNQQDNEPIY